MHELKPKDHPDYRCRRDGWYHDYSNSVVDNEVLIIEICVRCGHKIQFNKDKQGRIDNKRYGETHELWFLQPGHPFFDRYYPDFVVPPPKSPTAKMSFEEKKAMIAEELAKEIYKPKRQSLIGGNLRDND